MWKKVSPWKWQTEIHTEITTNVLFFILAGAQRF